MYQGRKEKSNTSMNGVFERPAPDGQFRLKPCDCGSEDVVYQSFQGMSGTDYRVKCLNCGRRTFWRQCMHDAQMIWNRVGVMEDELR